MTSLTGEGLSIFGENRDSANIASIVGMLGSVFYVDGTSGVDTNTGRTKDSPLLTVTAALALCTDSKGDVIQILRNSPSSPPATETFPIVVNKSNVTIRGTLGKGLLSDSGIASDTAGIACFEINAHYVTIEDLYVGCGAGNTVSGVIDGHASTAYWSFTLRRCMVNIQGSSAYGIAGKSGIGPYLLVEDCVFGRGHSTNFFTTAAIGIPDNATGGIIRRNRIAGGTIGISLAGTVVDMSVMDNRIQCYSNTKGAGITLGTGSGSGNYFDGNYANYGKTAMPTNPYKDTNANVNTWGTNFAGGIALMPATT